MAFIEIQFFLEESDVLSLLSGQLLKRAFSLTNKFIHLLLGDADDDRRASNTAADGDAPCLRFDPLSIAVRREDANAQRCNERQVPLHGEASHFDFDAQSEPVVTPPVMVVLVTLPPMATLPQSAWTVGA